MTAPSPVRLLVIGYGRMGRLVEALAPEYGCVVAGVLDASLNRSGEGLQPGAWRDVDVAVDFTTAGALVENLPRIAALRLNAVVGTTGWGGNLDAMRKVVDAAGIGAVVAPNFSPGAVVFEAVAERAAALFAPMQDVGAWLHEVHHDRKKDAPSGTALGIKAAMARAGYGRGIDVSSSRAGHVPGIHEVGFDGPSETVVLAHTVRDRGTFARGALMAARWVKGRRGWFTMRDVLGLER